MNEKELAEMKEAYSETFDISGKVDTNNPIYKFYEKDVAKYLNKFGGKKIVDNKGVSWIEIPITPEQGTAPVTAFKFGQQKNTDIISIEEANKIAESLFDKSEIEFLFNKDLRSLESTGQLSSEAVGFYRNEGAKGIIGVVENGGKIESPVLYHEAFHAYMDKFVSKAEKAQAINYVKKNVFTRGETALDYSSKNYETANIRAEEWLADDFARYVKEGSAPAELKSFYKKIVEKIRGWIRKLGKLEDLYNKILNKNRDYVRPESRKLPVTALKIDKNARGGIQTETYVPTISEADRLIADGKIRVVARDGKDVYQVKKGKDWVNTRDEDSAIKQVTKSKPTIPFPQAIEEKKALFEIKKEAIANNPAKQLEKFASKSGDFKGGLKEVTGSGKSVFGKKGDDIAQELGFKDSETAREEFLKLQEAKKELVQLKSEITDEVKAFKATPPAKDNRISDIFPEQAKSIEAQAEQSLGKVDEPYKKEVLPLPEIIRREPTSVKNKINALDYIRTPNRVLNKIGFGKEAKMIRTAYDNYVKELPKNIDRITKWADSLPKESSKNIFQYLDGQEVNLSEKELQVAGEIKVWLSEWAKRLGLEKENTITNYITHIFDEELLAKEFDEDLAKIIADKIPGQIYDPFVLKRLGAKGYIQDAWAALEAYVKRGTRKVHMDPALEAIQAKSGSSLEYSNIEASQYKYLQKYIHGVNMRPTDLDNAIDNTIKSVVGYKFGQRPVTALTKTLRKLTYRGMLGLNASSALRNISQGINTYATLGEKYTVIGYSKLLNPNSYKELNEVGVLKNNFIEDRTLSVAKKAMEKIDKGLFFFFETAEKINRGSAYFGAKAKALAKGKTEEEAVEYAKDLVRKTQFQFDSIDLPVALQSDIAKSLAQFQTFTIKQTEFLTEMAKDKNFVGLLRYAIGGLVFVYTIGRIFGMEPKEILPSFRFDTPPSLKLPFETFKAVADSPDKYGRQRSVSQKFKDVSNATVGLFPAGSQIKKTYQGYNAVKQGQSETSNGRAQFPVGGTPAKNAQALIFGKYANQDAKNYFNKVKTPEQKNLSDLIAEQTKNREKVKDQAKALYTELKSLTPAEANAKASEIKKSNPELFAKLKDVIAEDKKNLTTNEKLMVQLGVSNGKRSKYIYEELMKLPNKDAKNTYYKNLKDKKIVTKTVDAQIRNLIKQ